MFELYLLTLGARMARPLFLKTVMEVKLGGE